MVSIEGGNLRWQLNVATYQCTPQALAWNSTQSLDRMPNRLLRHLVIFICTFVCANTLIYKLVRWHFSSLLRDVFFTQIQLTTVKNLSTYAYLKPRSISWSMHFVWSTFSLHSHSPSVHEDSRIKLKHNLNYSSRLNFGCVLWVVHTKKISSDGQPIPLTSTKSCCWLID